LWYCWRPVLAGRESFDEYSKIFSKKGSGVFGLLSDAKLKGEDRGGFEYFAGRELGR